MSIPKNEALLSTLDNVYTNAPNYLLGIWKQINYINCCNLSVLSKLQVN